MLIIRTEQTMTGLVVLPAVVVAYREKSALAAATTNHGDASFDNSIVLGPTSWGRL